MDFYDQLINTQRMASVAASLEAKRVWDNHSVVTEQHTRALEKVMNDACDVQHKAQMLNAAGNKQNSYCLYTGDDLMVLNHLHPTIVSNLINQLIRDIQLFYGEKFKVKYTDQTFDGSTNSVRGKDGRICIYW